MILLTVYKEPAGKREKREFARLQEAIEFGQKTGSDYEIYDPHTGKVIDWNEINVREDDEWYYDEREYLWKRCRAEDETDELFHPGEYHCEMIRQTRNLQRAG
jgi:hypothetical protein